MSDKKCICGGNIQTVEAGVLNAPIQVIETCMRCRRRTRDGKVVDVGAVQRPTTPQIKR